MLAAGQPLIPAPRIETDANACVSRAYLGYSCFGRKPQAANAQRNAANVGDV